MQDTVQIPTSSDLVTVNCTVAFHEQCMSKDKCMQNCRTMGATSGRWFGESGGCCECIGHECAHLQEDISGPRCEGNGEGEDLDLLSDSEWDQLSDAEQEQYLESLRDEVNRLESQQRWRRRPKRSPMQVGLREEIERLASKWPSKRSSVGQ